MDMGTPLTGTGVYPRITLIADVTIAAAALLALTMGALILGFTKLKNTKLLTL